MIKNEDYFIFEHNVARRGAAMPAVLRVCAEGMLARGGGGRCVQVWRVYNFFFLHFLLCSTRMIAAACGAATPSPRSTDAVGVGGAAAGVDAARGVAAAAVVAGGSELGDDAAPTAAATTAERDKKVLYFKNKTRFF